MLYVSSLSRLKETVERTGATRMVSLINAGTPVERPRSIAADNHLFLGFNDIVDPVEGLVPPGEAHVSSLLDFVQNWDQSAPRAMSGSGRFQPKVAEAAVIMVKPCA